MNPSLETSRTLSILEVLPIVDAVVAQMSRHLPQHVSAEDLASAGKLALLEVLDDFDGSFAHDRGYVICRVRGAILDEMRRMDPLSRYGRAQVRLVRRAISAFETRHNRAPTDSELAHETGITDSEVNKIKRLEVAAEALSTDSSGGDNDTVRSLADPAALSPADLAEESDRASIIRAAVMRLTPMQSEVVHGYFFMGLSLQEIADDIGLSVVRVHQLKAAAEACLRGDLEVLDAWTRLRA
jgi:RNA polymerase sigma factor for flagellar operon FliA